MKQHNKIRIFLSTCLVALATVFCGVLAAAAPVKADAAETTLSATEFKADGASVRVFKKINGVYESVGERTGIRFHVEMGAGYTVNGTPLLDTSDTTTNSNGAYKMAEGYKTYTLVTPTSLLEGAKLTLDNMTAVKAQKIETTGYWFSDGDGNWESVAYIYNVPTDKLTQQFTFRGVIVSVDENGNETAIAYSDVDADKDTRHLAFVAKRAYEDTIDTSYDYWGSATQDGEAASLIKKLIPTYTITYNYTDTEGKAATSSEEVLWGDTPKFVPETTVDTTSGYVEKTATWYDTTGSEEIDVTATMDYSKNRELTLTSSTSAEFRFTGVADYNNFTYDGKPYSGAKIYATLPFADFFTTDDADGTLLPFDVDAVTVTYEGTGTFNVADDFQGVWALKEGSYVRLALAFNSTNMKSGDKLIVKGGSVFYVNGIMYKLTEDYTIDYSVVNNEEDYGIFLGYLHNSDIAKIENWDEHKNGERVRIRVTFKEDLLINSDFTIVFDGALPEGYTYPVYTSYTDVGTNKTTETEITKGYYYWNNGEHTILELEGYAYENDTNLYGAPGTKIVQNGGYYIFEDAMYAYFNGTDWVVGQELGSFGADAFDLKGSNYSATASDGTLAQEVRFTTNTNTSLIGGGTTNRWFDKVAPLNVENMNKDSQYAVYHTATDDTVTGLTDFLYHGQADANATDGYNHILAFRQINGVQAGETITIIKGTRLWSGAGYYTASEDIVFYYNGAAWVVNGQNANTTITASDFAGKNYNYFEDNTNRVRMFFTSEQFNGQSGPLYVESGSVKVSDTEYTNLYYHGGVNKIFEIIGGTTNPIGQNAFSDTLVIEAGTKLWMGMNSGTPYCIEFSETIEWIFVGQDVLRDSSGNGYDYDWIIPNNTDITRADVTRIYNDTGAGGEVRLTLRDGILTNDYYGFMAIDTSKGIPVVNGVEMPNHSFAYNQGNDLVAVRGGEYGTKLGDYIVIPKGSVWWTTQGSITFVDEIYGVWDGSAWKYGFNMETSLDSTLTSDVIEKVYNEGENEIRIRIPLGICDTYYSATALDGAVTLAKTDGTTLVTTLAQWYGGASGTYTANHSLIGLRGTGFVGAANGDVLTIKAGTKFIIGSNGYVEVPNDLVYTYVDGNWVEGNQNGTATYSGSNVTITGDTKVIIGKTYTFTVAVNSGYAVSAVNVNGKPLTLNTNNEYTFTAAATNDIVVETISTASAYKVSFVVGAGVTLDDGAIANGSEVYVPSGNSLTFKLELAEGYRLVSVVGADDNGDGTYTLKPTDATTVTITTVKQWTVTYTLNQSTASIYGQTVSSGATMTIDEGSYVVTVTANSGYSITGVSNATNNGDGTYTVNVNADMNVVVSTKQSIKLGASDITDIQVYDETQHDADFTGVRIDLDESTYTQLNSLSGGNYGMSMNGTTSITIGGSPSVFNASNPYNYFGKEHGSLLELRFATANLKASDGFVIKAGTVFDHNKMAYAIEFTEDIVGFWTGSKWIWNPVKAGDLDWNTVGIKSIFSYSDYTNGVATSSTIRISLKNALFNGTSDSGFASGNVTIGGSAYTGSWYYHGGENKILQISEWSYAKDQVLVIEAGTKIYIGNSYYVTTNTLTATCQADGTGANWTYTVS